MRIIDGQRARESEISLMVERGCPGLYLHSRTGKGLIRTGVPRLRFDQRSAFGWFWRIFGAHSSGLAITITAPNRSALNLTEDWCDIEIYLYDQNLLEEAGQIAAEYEDTTPNLATVCLTPFVEEPRWKPAVRFFAFAVAMAAVVIGLRLLSLHFLKNLLGL